MIARRPRLATAVIGTCVGVCIGAAAGALIGWSGASAFAPSAESPGYGGDAKALEVVVVGEGVRVSGSGFLASSNVTVTAGALTTTVVADEFGNIETTVLADGSESIAASGTTPTGSPTVSTPQLDVGTTGTSAAVVGAGLGAAPALMRSRRQKSR